MRKVQLINSAAEHLQSTYKLIAISQLKSACLDIVVRHPFQESHRILSELSINRHPEVGPEVNLIGGDNTIFARF